ncbi:MAG TPA: metal-sensitive transcriptional regulator [Thermoleophilia bacterium]|nr:metal-sensitive transcriptional regulator [Thermoleophilia bacterium]
MTDTASLHQAPKDDVARVLNRLRRIEGQVRGLQRMINEGKECEEVLMQLSAVKSALDRVGIHLISHRMKECLETESRSEVDEAAMEQAFEIFLKYVQCVR